MSWLSDYKSRVKRYNTAYRELKEKGEVDLTKMRDIKWAFYDLFFAFISFSLPYLVLIEYYDKSLFLSYQGPLTVLLEIYLFVAAAIYLVIWWQYYKFDSEVNKKVKAYLKQKEANYER